eukprot:353268-Chlamydomonas_euryale.AAC.6
MSPSRTQRTCKQAHRCDMRDCLHVVRQAPGCALTGANGALPAQVVVVCDDGCARHGGATARNARGGERKLRNASITI